MIRTTTSPNSTPSAREPAGAGAKTLSCSRHVARASTILSSLALLLPVACTRPPSQGETDGTTTGPDPSTTAGADTDASTTETTGPIEPDDWDELLDPVPGSRLRPIVRVADDGTRVHIGWHDTMFDAPCELRVTDGVLRCLPVARTGDPWHYADPDCTEPALQESNIPDGAVVVTVRDGCFENDFWEVGEPVPEIYYNENGPCEFFSNDPARRVYALPPEQFVAATVAPRDGSSRIVPLVLEAEDGARQIVGAWDRVHEEEVVPGLDGTGQLRWFGRWGTRISTYYYADPACTEPAALAECIPSGQQPRTAIEAAPGSCGAVLGHHELLDEVGSVYALDGDECVQADTYSATARAWRVGAPLDDEAFAATPYVNDGGERLRHDVFANPEGEPFLSSQRLHDLLLSEVECEWRETPPPGSGTLDCLPRDAPTPTGDFADPECTQSTARRSLFEGECLEPPLYANLGPLVWAVLGPTGSPDYTRNDQDDCVPIGDEGASGEGGDGGGEEEFFLIEDDPLDVELAHAADMVE